MRVVALLGVSLLLADNSAMADVIIPGPPVIPISLSRSQVTKMDKAARVAVAGVFDASLFEQHPYLAEASRAASKREITRMSEIISVSVVGDRAFVLAVTDKWLRAQTIGPVYSYLQCKFDDEGQVVAVDFID